MFAVQGAAFAGVSVFAGAGGRAVIAALAGTVLAGSPEHLQFLLPRAFDAEAPHVRVRAYVRVREMPALPEKDIESESQDTQADEHDGSEEHLEHKELTL